MRVRGVIALKRLMRASRDSNSGSNSASSPPRFAMYSVLVGGIAPASRGHPTPKPGSRLTSAAALGNEAAETTGNFLRDRAFLLPRGRAGGLALARRGRR